MYKISRNTFLEIEYLFLAKKWELLEVIIENDSVRARVDDGDLFVSHQVLFEYSVLYQK